MFCSRFLVYRTYKLIFIWVMLAHATLCFLFSFLQWTHTQEGRQNSENTYRRKEGDGSTTENWLQEIQLLVVCHISPTSSFSCLHGFPHLLSMVIFFNSNFSHILVVLWGHAIILPHWTIFLLLLGFAMTCRTV